MRLVFKLLIINSNAGKVILGSVLIPGNTDYSLSKVVTGYDYNDLFS